MLHATWLRSQPSVHFLQYEWFGLRAQTKSRLHIIRIFLSSFCHYLNTRHSNFRLVMRITLWFLSQTWAMLYRGLLPESQYLPWVMSCTRVSVDRMQLLIVPRSVMVTRTSSGPWHSWHGVMTVSRECEDVMLSRIRPTPVMSARVTTLHPLVTSANINTNMIQDKILPPFLPKYLYQNVCPPDSCYC